MLAPTHAVSIAVPGDQTVSGLFDAPAAPYACCVLAHGAGAGMRHPFLAAIASGLAGHGLAVLRYQFPYMERGAKRPDPPRTAQAAVRAAVIAAHDLVPDCPLFAGGKSFGGRMTSQALAADALPAVRGLVFLGFPLHAAGRSSVERADHLSLIHMPMLFAQGTRDALAHMNMLRPVIDRLGPQATLIPIDGADHSFHVPAHIGQTDAQIWARLVAAIDEWTQNVLGIRHDDGRA